MRAHNTQYTRAICHQPTRELYANSVLFSVCDCSNTKYAHATHKFSRTMKTNFHILVKLMAKKGLYLDVVIFAFQQHHIKTPGKYDDTARKSNLYI